MYCRLPGVHVKVLSLRRGHVVEAVGSDEGPAPLKLSAFMEGDMLRGDDEDDEVEEWAVVLWGASLGIDEST